jgi:hypothetical protein
MRFKSREDLSNAHSVTCRLAMPATKDGDFHPRLADPAAEAGPAMHRTCVVMPRRIR